MKDNTISAVVAFAIEGYLISVFINEAIKLFNSNANANVIVLSLSAIGIVGIASLAFSLFK